MSNVPIDQWGIRLSDRLLATLAQGDLDTARALLDDGDGMARNLAKEFTLMYRGLGLTIRVMLRLLPGLAARLGRAADFAAHVHDFAQALSAAFAGAWQAPAPMPRTTGALADEILHAERTLATGEADFERAHQQNAEAVRAALLARDVAQATRLVRHKVDQLYLPVHDRLVRFMADTMALVYRLGGAAALERFHFDTAEGQKAGFDKWEQMPAAEFARASAFLLKQHMGELTVQEDALRFTLQQSLCGSGGRLQTLGAYAGADALPFVEQPGAQTFGRPRLPVYCTHCPIWNGAAPLRWYGRAHWVFDAPARPDGSCTAHIYKRREDVPAALIAPLRV